MHGGGGAVKMKTNFKEFLPGFLPIKRHHIRVDCCTVTVSGVYIHVALVANRAAIRVFWECRRASVWVSPDAAGGADIVVCVSGLTVIRGPAAISGLHGDWVPVVRVTVAEAIGEIVLQEFRDHVIKSPKTGVAREATLKAKLIAGQAVVQRVRLRLGSLQRRVEERRATQGLVCGCPNVLGFVVVEVAGTRRVRV